MMPHNSTAVPYISVYVGFQLLLCVISTVVSVVATPEVKRLNDKDSQISSVFKPDQLGNQTINPSICKKSDQVVEIENKIERRKENSNEKMSAKKYIHLSNKSNFAMIVLNIILQVLSAVILFSLYWM
jgi:hypothetical protein